MPDQNREINSSSDPICTCGHSLAAHDERWWDEDDTGRCGVRCGDHDGCNDFVPSGVWE